MDVAQPGISCISLFIHVPCQYTLPLVNFIINNQEIFQTNSFIHKINTRNKHHPHRRNANLSRFQKSTFYASIKILNTLPPSLRILNSDRAEFKTAVRQYQDTHSTYSADNLLCVKIIYNFFFVKCFSILHCKFVCVYLLLVPHPAVFFTHLWIHVIYICIYVLCDRLCGLVVRVSGYRYRGPGFDPRRYQIF